MEEALSSEIIDIYVKLKFIRAVARQTGLSRERIREILVKNNVKLLTNDESLILRRKHPRKVFDGNEYEKAYLYGFVLGDVHVFRKSKFTLRAITHTTRRCFVDLFVKEFHQYGKIRIKPRKTKNEVCLSVDLDYESFKFLEQRNEDVLPNWINSKNFLSFFAGFVDSDGSVLIRKAGKYSQYVVKVFGQNTRILTQISQYLREIGLRPCLNRVFKAGHKRIWKGKLLRYNKDYYALEIYRKEDTLRLLNNLDLRHKEKMVRKKQLLEIYKTKVIRWDEIKEVVTKLRKQIEEEEPKLLGLTY